MTGIDKGQPWGLPGELPKSAPVAHTDAQVVSLRELQHGVIGVDEGDLARTLGIRKPYDRTTPKHLVPVDAICVELNGRSLVAVAHVVIGRFMVSPSVTAIMNAAFVGTRNLAPRAHPGDGLADVVSMNLSLADRYKARGRMSTGSHLPHPGIKITRAKTGEVSFERPRTVMVDGVPAGRARTVRYEIVPAFVTIAVS